MGYVITGVVCLFAGALLGILVKRLCVASKNSEFSIEDRQGIKEDEQC